MHSAVLVVVHKLATPCAQSEHSVTNSSWNRHAQLLNYSTRFHLPALHLSHHPADVVEWNVVNTRPIYKQQILSWTFIKEHNVSVTATCLSLCSYGSHTLAFSPPISYFIEWYSQRLVIPTKLQLLFYNRQGLIQIGTHFKFIQKSKNICFRTHKSMPSEFSVRLAFRRP